MSETTDRIRAIMERWPEDDRAALLDALLRERGYGTMYGASAWRYMRRLVQESDNRPIYVPKEPVLPLEEE